MVAEVAGEYTLCLATDKEESMVLQGGEGLKRSRNGLVEQVK